MGLVADTDRAGASRRAARATRRTGLRRFLRHEAGVMGLVLAAALVLAAFLGPSLWADPTSATYPAGLAPGPSHPFGTDAAGVDLLASVLAGTRGTVCIAVLAAVLASVIGGLAGLLASLVSGPPGDSLGRLVDPALCLAMLVGAVLVGQHTLAAGSADYGGWRAVALVLALLTAWLPLRGVAGLARSAHQRNHVLAARALGASTPRAIYRHVLPTVLDVLIVNAAVVVALAVACESALSLLGYGVRRPDLSIGLLIREHKAASGALPWSFWYPCLFLALALLAADLLALGLRDALDPGQKRTSA